MISSKINCRITLLDKMIDVRYCSFSERNVLAVIEASIILLMVSNGLFVLYHFIAQSYIIKVLICTL